MVLSSLIGWPAGFLEIHYVFERMLKNVMGIPVFFFLKKRREQSTINPFHSIPLAAAGSEVTSEAQLAFEGNRRYLFLLDYPPFCCCKVLSSANLWRPLEFSSQESNRGSFPVLASA